MRNLEFLKKSKATLQNFVLNEDDEVWTSKLGFVSGPTFSVYDQTSKRVKTFSLVDAEYRPAEVEQFLHDLAKAKLSGKKAWNAK